MNINFINNLMMRLAFLTSSNYDLFSSEWGMGNLGSIPSIKQALTVAAVFVISVIGFIIVIASICKISINGLYTTFNKFWDKVYEAKQNAEGNFSDMTGKNTGVIKRAQSISQMILCMFPNVKAMSEFEDGNNNKVPLDSKAFFLRAVPACVFAIFIGYFIYAGYPLALAEKFSVAGGQVLDIVLVNIDPVATAKNLFHTFEKPEYSTNGSTNPYYQAVNKVTQSAYTAYVGRFKDIKSDPRKKLGLELETWVTAEMNEYSDYFVDGAHEYSYETLVLNTDPDISKINGVTNTDGVITFAFKEQASKWQTGTAISTEGWWIVCRVQLTPVATAKVVDTVDCKMFASFTNESSGATISVTSSTGTFVVRGNANGVTNAGNVSIKVSADGKTLTFNKQANGDVSAISGLYYNIDGANHKIVSIVSDNTASIPKFSAIDESLNVPNWSFGEVPVIKKDETAAPTTVPSTENNEGL